MKNKWIVKTALVAGTFAFGLTLAGQKTFADEVAPFSEDVRFTKTLVTPSTDVADIPNMTFTFNFKDGKFYPYDANNVATTPEKDATVPIIKQQTISFTNDEMTTASSDGKSILTKQSKDVLLNEDNKKIIFPKVGVYEYKVVEDQTTPKLDKGKMNFSNKEYTLRIWVKSDENGGTTAGGTVEDTTIQKTEVTDANGAKVDPTPVTPTNPEDPKNPDENKDNAIVPEPAEGKTFNFKNVYVVDANPNPDPDPEKPTDPTDPTTSAFYVTKTVKGEKGDQTKLFDFDITVELNDFTKEQTYKLITVRDGETSSIDVTPGESTKFTLKHGDAAYFETMPAGTNITVKETKYADYDATNEATWNGAAPKADKADATGILGTKANKVDYTNKHNGGDVTPTGIILNNLPYLALIIAGGLGLGAYFYNKRRQA